MNYNVRRYKSRLKKKLHCMHKTRRELLGKFDDMLNGFLDENPNASFNDLCTAFGPPEEMARILMAEISGEETRKYRLHLQFKRLLAGFCAAAILVFTFYILFYKEFRNINYSEATYIGTGLTDLVDKGE